MNNSTKPKMIKDSKGKRPAFYDNDSADQLMSMVMVLASELNVLRDRLDAQERVTANHGIAMAQEIENLELDDNALQEREAWRQAFMDRLFYLARKKVTEVQEKQTSYGFNDTISSIAEQ